MYYQIKMGGFHEGFSRNTVYRFLDNAHMNWQTFLLRLSYGVIRCLMEVDAQTVPLGEFEVVKDKSL